MRILITDGLEKSAIAALEDRGHEVVEQHYAPEALGNALRDYDAVIVRSATKIRRPQLEAAKGSRLKYILRAGVGIDNIDADAAQAMGITVQNTPNAPTNAVAELAVALMFSCARYLSISGHTMRQGKWEKKAYGKGFELRGKKLGIIGFGRIGQRIGAIAQGIGMTVFAYDPYPSKAVNMVYLPLEQLLQEADIIAVSAPAMQEPIINRETIAKMKDGAVIINTSRGCNVDEDALLEALNSGKIRCAGLDVWADEPSRNEALYTHPAVSCTPHIGASTLEAQAQIGSEIVQIIDRIAAE